VGAELSDVPGSTNVGPGPRRVGSPAADDGAATAPAVAMTRIPGSARGAPDPGAATAVVALTGATEESGGAD